MTDSEVRETAELKKRIRRALYVLRSMAEHMAAVSKNSEESALHLLGRIGAIARVALLPLSSAGMDMEALVRDEMLARAARCEQFLIRGPGVRLPAKAAEIMSLAIHELATNSVKFGVLSQSGGLLTIAWRPVYRLGSPWLLFEWVEVGVRMNTDKPRAPGFGCELIERLIASELRGEGRMAFFSEGVHCTIEIPLPKTHE